MNIPHFTLPTFLSLQVKGTTNAKNATGLLWSQFDGCIHDALVPDPNPPHNPVLHMHKVVLSIQESDHMSPVQEYFKVTESLMQNISGQHMTRLCAVYSRIICQEERFEEYAWHHVH